MSDGSTSGAAPIAAHGGLVDEARPGVRACPGLDSVERHIARVRARVRKGGHDIPEADIRRRFDNSRLNLIHLLPKLAALRVYDNSVEADPAKGQVPEPRLVLHTERGKIIAPADLSDTPDWAKPIVAAAILHSGGAATR